MKKEPVAKGSKKIVAEKLSCFIYCIFRRTLKSKIKKFSSFGVQALPFLQEGQGGHVWDQ